MLADVQKMTAEEGVELAGRSGQASHMLCESVVSDVQWSALHVGILAYAMNARIKTGGNWNLHAWRNLLQDNAPVVRLGLRFCDDIGVVPQTAQAIEEMYDRFAQLKQKAVPLVAVAGQYSPVQVQELTGQIPAWLELCQITIEALKRLDANVAGQLDERYHGNAQVLMRFLQDTVNGQTNRMNAWGELTLPELAQRRRSPRARARGKCTLIARGQRRSAVLLDVSRHGIGIKTDISLHDLEKVAVILSDGRRLDATVVRASGEHIGLELNTQLDYNDPLLASSA